MSAHFNALTPEQKSSYLRDPKHCPYCGRSTTTTTGEVEPDAAGRVREAFSCNTCDREWVVTYTVSDVVDRKQRCEECAIPFTAGEPCQPTTRGLTHVKCPTAEALGIEFP